MIDLFSSIPQILSYKCAITLNTGTKILNKKNTLSVFNSYISLKIFLIELSLYHAWRIDKGSFLRKFVSIHFRIVMLWWRLHFPFSYQSKTSIWLYTLLWMVLTCWIHFFLWKKGICAFNLFLAKKVSIFWSAPLFGEPTKSSIFSWLFYKWRKLLHFWVHCSITLSEVEKI